MMKKLTTLFKQRIMAQLGVFCLCLVSWAVFAEHDEASKSSLRDRLGKVFYWQIADELSLKPDDEKKLVEVLEKNQKKREDLLHQREDLFKSYHTDAGKVNATLSPDKFIASYQNITKGMSSIDTEELMALKKVLNPAQLTQFLLVRDIFSKKVRDSLRRVESRKSVSE